MRDRWKDPALERRRLHDDMYIGALWTPIVDARIEWGFKIYDPRDTETFPLELEFQGASKALTRKNAAKVFILKNDDILDVYMDSAYCDLILTTVVALDYEKDAIPDPTKPSRPLQMIYDAPVHGIPKNINRHNWFELFAVHFPAVIYRNAGDPLTLG